VSRPYLNLTSGVKFGFYAAEGRVSGRQRWRLQSPEDQPSISTGRMVRNSPAWGTVVGKYPDDPPAIVEGTFGGGWVILTGVHPEAPADCRRGMSFDTPASVDNAYAGTLIHAALNRASLSHF
jgi:hypothetical protein